MKKLISIAVLGVVILASAAHAQDNANRVTVNWSDPSRPGLVKVMLLSGGISVRSHSGKEVIVEGSNVGRERNSDATRDGLRRIPLSTRGFVLEESNNVMTISRDNFFDGGNIEIQVPARTNLQLSSVNGSLISVDGVEGDIEINSTNGRVMLNNVAGSVVANATNGNLTATIREVAANKPMSFSSMNSNVDVTLPASTKANLKINSTNGSAWSDFDLKMGASSAPVVTNNRNGNGKYRIETERTTNATINGGGIDIELRTFNGTIYLRKGK